VERRVTPGFLPRQRIARPSRIRTLDQRVPGPESSAVVAEDLDGAPFAGQHKLRQSVASQIRPDCAGHETDAVKFPVVDFIGNPAPLIVPKEP
jgi:hypothetical protein